MKIYPDKQIGIDPQGAGGLEIVKTDTDSDDMLTLTNPGTGNALAIVQTGSAVAAKVTADATNLGFLDLATPSNGAVATVKMVTTEITGMSGATATASELIPAGSLVIGVACRVTTEITGATTFTIGDGSNAEAFGTGIALAAGTTTTLADWVMTTAPVYASATSIVLTATGSNFTAGAVRVTVWYITLTAPTS